MADVLEKLVVEIRTDQTKLKKEFRTLETKMGKEGRSLGGKFGKSFSKGFMKVGGIIAIGLAIKKAWDFATITKNFARDANEIKSKFNVVFKGLEQEALDWTKTFGDSIGRASSELQEFTGGLGDVLKPLGFTTKEALSMSQAMTGLALDVASFNNRQDKDVIRAFTSALTGERESLKTLGIVMSEADVKQEAYNSGLIARGKALTKTAKAQATMNLLFKNSTDAQGDLIRTGDSLANLEKRQQAQNKTFMEQLGNETIPTFKILTTYLTELFTNVENNQSVMDAFGVVVKTIGSGLVLLVGTVKASIDGLIGLYEISTAILKGDYAAFVIAQLKMGESFEKTFGDTIDSITQMWQDSPLGGGADVKNSPLNKTLKAVNTEIVQTVGLLGKLEEQLSVLEEKRPFAQTSKDLAEIDKQIMNINIEMALFNRAALDIGRTRGSAGYNTKRSRGDAGYGLEGTLGYDQQQDIKEALNKYEPILKDESEDFTSEMIRGANEFGSVMQSVLGMAAGSFINDLNTGISTFLKILNVVSAFTPSGVLGGLFSTSEVAISGGSSVGVSNNLINKVADRVGALTEVVRSQQQPITIVTNVGGQEIAREVHTSENRMNRQNIQRTSDF